MRRKQGSAHDSSRLDSSFAQSETLDRSTIHQDPGECSFKQSLIKPADDQLSSYPQAEVKQSLISARDNKPSLGGFERPKRVVANPKPVKATQQQVFEDTDQPADSSGPRIVDLLELDLAGELAAFNARTNPLIVRHNEVDYPMRCPCELKLIALCEKKRVPRLFPKIKFTSADYAWLNTK